MKLKKKKEKRARHNNLAHALNKLLQSPRIKRNIVIHYLKIMRSISPFPKCEGNTSNISSAL